MLFYRDGMFKHLEVLNKACVNILYSILQKFYHFLFKLFFLVLLVYFIAEKPAENSQKVMYHGPPSLFPPMNTQLFFFFIYCQTYFQVIYFEIIFFMLQANNIWWLNEDEENTICLFEGNFASIFIILILFSFVLLKFIQLFFVYFKKMFNFM